MWADNVEETEAEKLSEETEGMVRDMKEQGERGVLEPS